MRGSRLLDEVLSFFGGRAQPMMAQLVEAGKLTRDDLREIEKAIEQHTRTERPSSREPGKKRRRRKESSMIHARGRTSSTAAGIPSASPARSSSTWRSWRRCCRKPVRRGQPIPSRPEAARAATTPRHSLGACCGPVSTGGDPTGTAGRDASAGGGGIVAGHDRPNGSRLRLAIGWVIDHLWQSTLFAIVVGLLTLAFRRNRARVRYALWFSASVKFLVPFSLVMWLGSVIGSSALRWSSAADPVIARSTAGIAPDYRRTRSTSARRVTAALWPSTFTISEVAAAWLGSGAARHLDLRFLRDCLVPHQAVAAALGCRPDQPPRRAARYGGAGAAAGGLGGRSARTRRHRLAEPGPADARGHRRHLTRPEIEAIVAHELCHVRRFDNMTAAIHMLGGSHLLVPSAGLVARRPAHRRTRTRLRRARARSVGAPGPYAQGILNVCKRYVESPLASVSGVGSANVRQRIDAILANRIGEATGPWKKVMLSGDHPCVVIVPLAAGALQAPPRADAAAASVQSVSVPGASGYALVLARADGRLGPELRRETAGTQTRLGLMRLASTAHPRPGERVRADAP